MFNQLALLLPRLMSSSSSVTPRAIPLGFPITSGLHQRRQHRAGVPIEAARAVAKTVVALIHAHELQQAFQVLSFQTPVVMALAVHMMATKEPNSSGNSLEGEGHQAEPGEAAEEGFAEGLDNYHAPFTVLGMPTTPHTPIVIADDVDEDSKENNDRQLMPPPRPPPLRRRRSASQDPPGGAEKRARRTLDMGTAGPASPISSFGME